MVPVARLIAALLLLGSCGSGITPCGEPDPVDQGYVFAGSSDDRNIDELELPTINSGLLLYENPSVSFTYSTLDGAFEATLQVAENHKGSCLSGY